MRVERLYGRAKKSKLIGFFWSRALPMMMSSQLIRLKKPLPPSGEAISENENNGLLTVTLPLGN